MWMLPGLMWAWADEGHQSLIRPLYRLLLSCHYAVLQLQHRRVLPRTDMPRAGTAVTSLLPASTLPFCTALYCHCTALRRTSSAVVWLGSKRVRPTLAPWGALAGVAIALPTSIRRDCTASSCRWYRHHQMMRHQHCVAYLRASNAVRISQHLH